MTTLYTYRDDQTGHEDILTAAQVRADLTGIHDNLNPANADAWPVWHAVGCAVAHIDAGRMDKAAGMLSEIGITLTEAAS